MQLAKNPAAASQQREDARWMGRSVLGALEQILRRPVREKREDSGEDRVSVWNSRSNCPATKMARQSRCRSMPNFRPKTINSIAAQDGAILAIDEAMKSLETQLPRSAKEICQEYIQPPRPRFRVMLADGRTHAEAIRRVGGTGAARIAALCLPDRQLWPRCSTVCRWDFYFSRSKNVRAKFGIYLPRLSRVRKIR